MEIDGKVFLRGVARLILLGLAFFVWQEQAYAHGSMEDPVGRVYHCYQEGPEHPQSEACKAAVLAGGTQQFYDWTGVNQLAADHHRSVVPDGKLCSAGKESHKGLDLARADWWTQAIAPDANGNYEFVFLATAPHSTRYFEFYVTKDGYNPTQPLRWSDLEATPFCRITSVTLEDGRYRMSCPLPQGKSGNHVIYNIWQREDSAEAFYTCMDVAFTNEGSPTPTVTTGTPVTAVPTATATPTPVATASNNSCHADYTITDQWSDGFTANVVITNQGATPINGWVVTWSFPGSQAITGAWNGRAIQSGSGVIVNHESWNGAIAAHGGQITIGFSATYQVANPIPATLLLNGMPCTTGNPAATPTATATPGNTSTPIPTSIPTAQTPVATPTTASSQLCRVDYTITSDWGSGFNADVAITNQGATPINGWTLTWTFPGNQTLTGGWNGQVTQSGAGVSAIPAGWNGTIGANGGKVTVGFGATYQGTNAKPTTFSLNGTPCATDGTPTTPVPTATTNTTPNATGTAIATATANATPIASPTVGTPIGSKEVVAYFTQWGVYDRNYHVKNMVTSGSAEKITVINYAFGNVVDGECIMTTQSGVMDAYADYQKSYTAADSVDGNADVWNQPLRGNFNQLKKLKQLHPQIKLMISLGGWTWSAGFHEAAKTAASRQKLVASCLDIYIRGNLPVADNAGGPGVAAGLFDGIDIDWEYPGDPGVGNPYGPEDTHNFTLLLQEFRTQLDAIDPALMLTIASGAGVDIYSLLELDQIHPLLNYINIMTYDLHGAWDAISGFNAPLYTSPAAPYSYPSSTYAVDSAIQGYLAAGVPANKIIMGIPFYGRGWTGVATGNNGLWQSAAGPAPAAWEAGIEDYKLLKPLAYPVYRDEAANAVWKYNGNIFWSYDDPQTIGVKLDYMAQHALGGVMIWSLDGDTADGELITAIHTKLAALNQAIGTNNSAVYLPTIMGQP